MRHISTRRSRVATFGNTCATVVPPSRHLHFDSLRDSGQFRPIIYGGCAVSSGRNLLMRSPPARCGKIVCSSGRVARGHLLPDGQLSLAAAWSWLVGDSVVNRLRSKRVPLLVPRAFAVDTAQCSKPYAGQAEKAKDGCASGLSDASTSSVHWCSS